MELRHGKQNLNEKRSVLRTAMSNLNEKGFYRNTRYSRPSVKYIIYYTVIIYNIYYTFFG